MRRLRPPAALASVAITFCIAALIVAQSVFTFRAVLDTENLLQLTTSRNVHARQIQSLEGLLARQRLAERSYLVKRSPVFSFERAQAFSAFRTTIAGLLPAVIARRAAQLRRLDREAVDYERLSSVLLVRVDRGDVSGARLFDERVVQPRYIALSSSVATVTREYARRTSEMDARGLRRQMAIRNAALAALAVGLVLIAGLLALLEFYRRIAERALVDRVDLLQAMLRTDALTGLPNERAFNEVLASRANGSRSALLLLDLDDFKAVNDARGHVYGDQLLEDLGAALKAYGDDASLFRVGGDRFAMLWSIEGEVRPLLMAERVWRTALGALRGITISAGYACTEKEQPDPGLLESAEAALRRAKGKGGCAFVDFGELGSGVVVFSRVKAQAVRRILSEGRIPMFFQPIVDTLSGKTIAYEALARPDAVYGLRSADELFDIAERLYKHYELDRVCICSAILSAEKRPDALMFLNVVPASLESDRLDIDGCVANMGRAGRVPENIVLELTERKIANAHALAARLEELRSRGFRIALDDTGAGSAGLEVLSKITFDFVKLDRSLIVRAMEDERARGVLSGVLAIAQETGSTVIAEGIETTDMAAFAREFHARSITTAISAMQGYLFGKPAP